MHRMTATALPTPLLLSRPEAAKFIGLSPRQLWNLTNDGEIAHVRIRRSIRYRVDDLKAFVESRTVRAKSH